MGYLEQDPDSGKFRLGMAIFELNRALRENLDIDQIVVPYMRKITEEIGETVYLTIPRDDEVIYLEAAYPENQRLPGSFITGERVKMYCTAVGKSMLAYMEEDLREKYISRPLQAFTEYTITDKEKLREEIEKTKERGYGIDNMELVFGVKCVGIALINHKGHVEAGLSISGPSLRMSDEKIQGFVEILHRYGRMIEKTL
jgi:DNA-binding IclR family transcriptional regulator